MLINENTDTSPRYRLPAIIRDRDSYLCDDSIDFIRYSLTQYNG